MRVKQEKWDSELQHDNKLANMANINLNHHEPTAMATATTPSSGKLDKSFWRIGRHVMQNCLGTQTQLHTAGVSIDNIRYVSHFKSLISISNPWNPKTHKNRKKMKKDALHLSL